MENKNFRGSDRNNNVNVETLQQEVVIDNNNATKMGLFKTIASAIKKNPGKATAITVATGIVVGVGTWIGIKLFRRHKAAKETAETAPQETAASPEAEAEKA